MRELFTLKYLSYFRKSIKTVLAFSFLFLGLLGSLYALVSVTAEANLPMQLSLGDALQMALDRDVNLIVGQERVNQALARMNQSVSFLLPQVTGDISQKRQTRDLRSSGITLPGDPLVGPFNSFDARVKLTQVLFDRSALERFKTAQLNHQLSSLEYRKVREDTLSLVATFFIEAKRAAQSLKVYKLMLKRDQKQLNLLQSRFESGLSTAVELDKAKTSYAQSLSNWQMAQTDSIDKRLTLCAALGLPLEQEIVFSWDQNDLDRTILLENFSKKTVDQHPDVQVALQKFKFAQSQKSVEVAEYWPKIVAMADYGPSGLEPRDSNDTYTLGVQASVPIWEGGLRHARIKEMESEIKEHQANLEDKQRHIAAAILNAKQYLRQSEMTLKAKKLETHQVDEELKLAKERFLSGIGSNWELINALTQQVLVYDQGDDAVAAHLMAQINLAHAMGQLDQWAAALIENNVGD